MPAPNREFLMQLLSDARIKGPQLETTVAHALDAGYWRNLAPNLHLDNAGASIEFAATTSATTDEAVRAQHADGYFRLRGVIAPSGVQRLNDAIDALAAAGWPPAFVFMYDEAWQCGRSPATGRVMESALGPGYNQIRHVWVHVVKPLAGATGWAPHVDGDPGRRMTLWMGLTPSTLDNGCMHVVPRSATAASPDLTERFRAKTSTFTRTEVASMLHATHALEAEPGDALGWSFDIIHWGGYARRAGSERRGLSFEYIAADQPASDFDAPLVSMDALPSFDDRLRTIAKSIDAYRRFEPLLDRFADVASAITARLPHP